MSITRQLQSGFSHLAQRLDSRPVTERVLIFTSASLVIFMLVYVGLLAPIEKSKTDAGNLIEVKQNEMKLANQKLRVLSENLRQAPKESRLSLLEKLRNELKNTGAFSKLMEDLITPREMIRFVDGVLSSNKGITVVRARNVPAVRLWPATEKATTDDIETNSQQQSSLKDGFTIYKHGMVLEVKGHYRELVSFLATLEKLPWKILWGDVSLTSSDGNDSVSTLMIYTLSPEESWLGL